ncbi:MAG: hypothetical protein ACRD4P_02715 [Bryobacteraceae bacterium]
MALRDAVIRAGVIPADTVSQAQKKRYSELLSHHLAIEVADGLRALGFAEMRPMRQIVQTGKNKGTEKIIKEKEFQGGLGPKRVDVSFSDDRHGLMLAVSIKGINFPSFPRLRGSDPPECDYSKPGNFSKNVKNRFGDLTTESITLHLRFPFAVVACLYAMPERARTEKGINMKISTFERAERLYGTISGRTAYGDPAERFEDVTLMLYRPLTDSAHPDGVRVELFRAGPSERKIEESDYFDALRELYNQRNPHAMVGEFAEPEELDFVDEPRPEPDDEPH